MRKLISLAAITASLAVAAVAHAGGWATVELAAPPVGMKAGDTWRAELMVLQHGETPLAGVAPTVTIENMKNGATRTFSTKPTKRVGVYVADVVFPSSGSWRYKVYDGFEQYGNPQTHVFDAVPIGGGSQAWWSFDLSRIAGALALALALGVLLVFVARRPRGGRTRPAAT